MKLTLPAVFAADLKRSGNVVKQLHSPVATIEATAARYTRGRMRGVVLQPVVNPQDEILIVHKKIEVPESLLAQYRQ